MSAARRFLFPAVALLALAVALPAQAGESDVWITIERAAAHRALAAFGAAGHPGALAIEGAGNIVVARLSEDDVPFLADFMHRELRRCAGFMAHTTRQAADQEAARANGADGQRAALPPAEYTIDNGPVVQALMADLTEANARDTINSLGSFFTRYHNCPSGRASADWIRRQWRGYAGARSDVTVDLFFHTGYTTLQPSVILTIPGTTLPSEVVVLGAHQDSIAGSNCSTSRAPGQDDDGSGIASLSDVIRGALKLGYRPTRTVKFMAYAAEEVGLRGSNEIAASFQQQGVNVVGVLQLDMTNYKGSAGDIYIYTDNTNPTQNAFVAALVDTYLPGVTRGTSACGYSCSDHASWTSRGYPASFPFEAIFGQHNPYIHTANDTIDKSGGTATQALKFSKLAAAYLAEVAKGDLQPGPNPGPSGLTR